MTILETTNNNYCFDCEVCKPNGVYNSDWGACCKYGDTATAETAHTGAEILAWAKENDPYEELPTNLVDDRLYHLWRTDGQYLSVTRWGV